MNIHSKQKSNLKTQLIFKLWNEILEQKGTQTPDSDDIFEATYEFQIDRSKDQNSLLKVDEISVDRLTNIIDGFFSDDKGISNLLESRTGEKWLLIIINPQDPYDTELGRLSRQTRIVKNRQVSTKTEEKTEYLTKGLTVGISNLGKGFEFTKWEFARQLKQIPLESKPSINLRSANIGDPIDKVHNLTKPTLKKIKELAYLAKQGKIIES